MLNFKKNLVILYKIIKFTYINQTMKIVKKIREILGVKQSMIAEWLDIQQSNYSKIENGKLIPNNIEDIKNQSLNILRPALNEHIAKKELELKELKEIYKSIKN